MRVILIINWRVEPDGCAMTDLPLLNLLRPPPDLLTALASRSFQFALQPYHYLLRLAHVLSAGAFFGAIVLVDLRLLGLRRSIPLNPIAAQAGPLLYTAFAVAFTSGALLFLYDPVHVGNHAYFVPKMLLLALGLGNAALFHRTGYAAALAAGTDMPRHARIAGFASLVFWVGTVVCASLNSEAAPKVLLH
jgi:hypothetical protein